MTYKENFKKYLFGLFSSIFASCAMLNVAMGEVRVKYCCSTNESECSNTFDVTSNSTTYTFKGFNDAAIQCSEVSSDWWSWICTNGDDVKLYAPNQEVSSTDLPSNSWLNCRPAKNIVFAYDDMVKDFDYDDLCSGANDSISLTDFGTELGIPNNILSGYLGWCIGSEASDGWYAGQAVFECTAKIAENPNLSCTTIQDYMTRHSVNHVFIRLAMDTVDYKCSNDGAVLDQHSLLPDLGPAEPLSSLELCGKSGWDCVKGITHPVGGNDEHTKTCSAAGDVTVIYDYNNGTCDTTIDCTCNNSLDGYGVFVPATHGDLCYGLCADGTLTTTSCGITESVYQILNGDCSADTSCGCTYTAKKPGYKIEGWYNGDTSVATNKVGEPGGSLTCQENWNYGNSQFPHIVLTANWEPIQFNITYDSDSVAGSNNSEVNTDNTYDITRSVSIQDIEKDGWIFLGWCEQEDCEHPLKGENAPVIELPSDVNWTQTEEQLHGLYDKHFYAMWEKDGPCGAGDYVNPADNKCYPCPTEYPNSYAGDNNGITRCYTVCPLAGDDNTLVPDNPGVKVYYGNDIDDVCTYTLSCLDGKWLHVGDEKMCLISGDPSATQKPALRIQRGSKKYYLPLKDSSVDGGMPMTCDSTKKLHLHWNDTTYDAYDALAEYCMSTAADSTPEELAGVVDDFDNSMFAGFDLVDDSTIGQLRTGLSDEIVAKKSFADRVIDNYKDKAVAEQTYENDKLVIGDYSVGSYESWKDKLRVDYHSYIDASYSAIGHNIGFGCGKASLVIVGEKPMSVYTKTVTEYNNATSSGKIYLKYDDTKNKCFCENSIEVFYYPKSDGNPGKVQCSLADARTEGADPQCIYKCKS